MIIQERRENTLLTQWKSPRTTGWKMMPTSVGVILVTGEKPVLLDHHGTLNITIVAMRGRGHRTDFRVI